MEQIRKVQKLLKEWDEYSSVEMAEKMPSRILNKEKESIAKIVTFYTKKHKDTFSKEEQKKIEEMESFLQKIV